MKSLLFEPRRVSCPGVQHIADNVDDEEFIDLAGRMTGGPYAAVLLSGGELDCSRYSIAAADPFLVLSSKGRDLSIKIGREKIMFRDDPLDTLNRLCNWFKPDFPRLLPPFSGGAVGYFSYDLKNIIERLPQTAEDDLNLPDILVFWPRTIMAHDRQTGRLSRISLIYEGDPGQGKAISERLSTPSSPSEAAQDVGPLKSNFSRESYLEALRKVRRYIREGDVYQVNLSQRFTFPFRGDPYRLWRSLFEMNPAPFYAFIQACNHQILSTSMERFLFRDREYVETRPIKGTRPRGATPEQDAALRRELEQSAKDDAELSMIVDLLRNDLGKVSEPASVRVAEHKRMEAYQNVYHLVSTVTGSLRKQTSHSELLRATFPGGSITGCPKIRAMEIIDELEPLVRHVYTGAIGYLGWHDNLDLNVAIRTVLITGGKAHFSVGGGIVYDSVEEDEYEETLHKGRTVFQWLEKCGGGL